VDSADLDSLRCFMLKETLVVEENRFCLIQWAIALYNLINHACPNSSIKMLEIPPEAIVEIGCKLLLP